MADDGHGLPALIWSAIVSLNDPTRFERCEARVLTIPGSARPTVVNTSG